MQKRLKWWRVSHKKHAQPLLFWKTNCPLGILQIWLILKVEQHPPGGNVYLVYVDSAAGDPSQAGGECEKGDDQGVVAAHIIYGQ